VPAAGAGTFTGTYDKSQKGDHQSGHGDMDGTGPTSITGVGDRNLGLFDCRAAPISCTTRHSHEQQRGDISQIGGDEHHMVRRHDIQQQRHGGGMTGRALWDSGRFFS